MSVIAIDHFVELKSTEVWSSNFFFRLIKNDFPATGRITSLRDDGEVLSRLMVRRGLRHGLYEIFHSNGDLKYWCHYSNGKLELYDELYDTHLRLVRTRCYQGGKLHGTTKEYENSHLTARGTYKNGKRHGIFKNYGPNLVTRFRGRYLNGKRQGWHVVRYDNNKTKKEYCWDKDIPTGRWRTFFECGQLKRETYYKNGSRVDGRRTYFKDSVLKSSANFLSGQLDGNSIYYYPNGQLKISRPYCRGVLNGIERQYRPGLQLRRERTWVNGNLKADLSFL